MKENLDSSTFNSFLSGDKTAFEVLYKKYYSSLVTYAYKYVDSQDDSKDIVNEVFVSLYNSRNRYTDEQHLRASLFVSARNLCLNYLKSKKRHAVKSMELDERLQDDNLLKYEYMIRAEVVKMVHEAIENLPDDCRRIFKMLFYDELKPADIAVMLQISVNNIYVQKSNALRILRIKVGPYLLLFMLLLRLGRLLQIFLLDTVAFRK